MARRKKKIEWPEGVPPKPDGIDMVDEDWIANWEITKDLEELDKQDAPRDPNGSVDDDISF